MTLPIFHDAAETHQHSDTGASAFPPLSKLLHWITAGLVLVMLCTGVIMKQVGDGPWADALYTFHKTAGAGLLALVAIRLSYRAIAHLTGRWKKGAGSRPVHAVLYVGLVVVPLLGLAGIADFGARTVYFGVDLPAVWPEGAGYASLLLKTHAWLAFTLIALVAIHIGVALGDYIQRGGRRGLEDAAAKKAFAAGPDMS